MAITYDITKKVRNAMIAYLGDNTDLTGTTIVEWKDATNDPVYPSIMVSAEAYDNPEFGKNILLAENMIVNIGVFTLVVDDLNGDVIEQLVGFVRNSVIMDDIEAQLNLKDLQLHVYTNGVMISSNTASDDDLVRQRNINLEIACTVQDDGL